MATESLTYVEIGERLGVSAHAARALARRLHLPRVLDNHGRARVTVDFAEIQHRPQPAPGPPDHEHATVIALQARVADLLAELAAERERSATDLKRERERADYERDRADRERKRADSLVEIQLPALRSILEMQESVVGEVAVLRGRLDRAGRERDRVDHERERADSLVDQQLPAMQIILEAQNGIAGDIAALRALLDHVYGDPATDGDTGDTDADIVENDADTGAADFNGNASRSWWWPFRRAG